MKKLLITGFEPFGGECINPSWEAVAHLEDEVGGYALTRLCLPVVFGEAAKLVISAAEEIGADAVLCIGQAGGRSAITPELVGINLRNGNIPDNNGNQPRDEEIITGGDKAYFSTLPVRKMAEAVSAVGIPSQVSYSAGAYVCNDVLYSVLAHFAGTKTSAAFVHIPYCKEQGKEPSMELEQIIRALTVAIENMD